MDYHETWQIWFPLLINQMNLMMRMIYLIIHLCHVKCNDHGKWIGSRFIGFLHSVVVSTFYCSFEPITILYFVFALKLLFFNRILLTKILLLDWTLVMRIRHIVAIILLLLLLLFNQINLTKLCFQLTFRLALSSKFKKYIH